MRRTERIVFALAALGEAGQTILLAQRLHAIPSTGQDFVRVALVANVPDQLVHRRVEDSVDRDRKLYHTQRRPKMPAGLRHDLYDFAAQFTGQSSKLVI